MYFGHYTKKQIKKLYSSFLPPNYRHKARICSRKQPLYQQKDKSYTNTYRNYFFSIIILRYCFMAVQKLRTWTQTFTSLMIAIYLMNLSDKCRHSSKFPDTLLQRDWIRKSCRLPPEWTESEVTRCTVPTVQDITGRNPGIQQQTDVCSSKG